MRILLVVPPYATTDPLVAALYPMPYGPVMIGSALRQAGHDVELRDYLLPAQAHNTERPASFEGKAAPRFAWYGMERSAMLADLDATLERGWDAVGLAAGQCNVWTGAKVVADRVRHHGIPLVAGGPFVTAATDDARAILQPDVVVLGEGEAVAGQAFRIAASGYGGMVRGRAVPLDYLPLPDWDLAPPSQYPRVGGRVRGVLAASRGCPHRCEFCAVRAVMGPRHRRASRLRLLAELQGLAAQGVTYFCFLDDNLFATPQAVEDVLWATEQVRGAHGRFYCEEGMEVRMAARPGLLGRLRDAGFDNIGVGLETMSDAARVGKPYTAEDLDAALREAEAAGVPMRGFYIVGLPGDTLASVARDIVALGSTGLAVRANNLKVLPGTDLERLWRDQGVVGEGYDWRLSSWWTPDTPDLTWPQVKRLRTYVRAVGDLAETYGIRAFADTTDEVASKLAAKGIDLRPAGRGVWEVAGSWYRPTTLRYLCELLVLRGGAAGAYTTVEPRLIRGIRALQPRDEVQGALAQALGTPLADRLFA